MQLERCCRLRATRRWYQGRQVTACRRWAGLRGFEDDQDLRIIHTKSPTGEQLDVDCNLIKHASLHTLLCLCNLGIRLPFTASLRTCTPRTAIISRMSYSLCIEPTWSAVYPRSFRTPASSPCLKPSFLPAREETCGGGPVTLVSCSPPPQGKVTHRKQTPSPCHQEKGEQSVA